MQVWSKDMSQFISMYSASSRGFIWPRKDPFLRALYEFGYPHYLKHLLDVTSHTNT